MKILVTGAGGFLGQWIVERLLARGETDIRAMLRSATNASRLQDRARRYPAANLEIVYANLKYKDQLASAVQDADVIIHAAAAIKGSPAEMFLDSVVGSRNLLDVIVAEGERRGKAPRVVLVSSFGVMGVPQLPRGATVDESCPMEQRPGDRDVYSYTKLRQEQLFWEYREKHGFDLVVLRPGVIYGPGGGHFSVRVGLNMFGVFLHLGGRNLLPLTYVENCADAIALAAQSPQAAGQIYNVVDDELITSRQYLAQYKRQVKPVRSVPVPYKLIEWGSGVVERYSTRSKGQLPAIFTPYKTKAMWGGNRFSNARLHALGWKPLVPTTEGLRRTFAAFRTQPAK